MDAWYPSNVPPSRRAGVATEGVGIQVIVPDEVAAESDDDVTRLLCAAAHLDSRFADASIRELLAEPLRATPPSPGVHAQDVLRECIAARVRRRRRDLTLAALMLLLLISNAGQLLLWIAAALVWRRVGPRTRRLDRGRAARLDGVQWLVACAVIVVVALLAVASLVMALFAAASSFLTGGSGGGIPFMPGPGYDSPAGAGPSFPLAMLFGLPLLLPPAMLAVLVIDRWAVWSLLTKSFKPGRYDGAVRGRFAGERWLRTAGSEQYAEQLRRFTAESTANTVVYRGADPFVGGGWRERPWSIAVALEPDDEHQGGDPDAWLRQADVNVHDLYQAVNADIARLREASSLSPSNRLARLRLVDQVLVAAEAVPPGSDDVAISRVFGAWSHPPVQYVDEGIVGWIAESPREWMRYYACYRVEGWSREVVVSLYVHFGTDDRNLYIDCFPCVLPPIRRRYRNPDTLPPGSTMPAVLDALGSWMVLPLTIPGRVKRAFSRIRPDPRATVGERYGARFSLREIAASNELSDYMQMSDAHRYLQIIQTRLYRAVGSYLESRGMSVVDFMRQADQVQEKFVIYGDATGAVLGGRHQNVSVVNGSGPTSGHATSASATS